MKVHIIGGGFGGLAAAALFIRNAGVPGQDITIYEADERLGGGFFLAGDAKSGYNLPGSIFDREFRCALDLLGKIPTQAYPDINVAEQFSMRRCARIECCQDRAAAFSDCFCFRCDRRT